LTKHAISSDEKNTRHILSLSGGKDSTALAIYLKDRISSLEYIFCDTGEELQETYDYLLKIEACLGKPIIRLNPERPFRHYLEIYRGVLPDPRTRWCTRMLKLRPFEMYVGNAPVELYVGIRADEPHRTGYVSSKPNIKPRFPFVEDDINQDDVIRILSDSGLGLPNYYEWRSRSGCYFCFFQQLREWIGLLERHPDLYWKAAGFEQHDPVSGRQFTWIQSVSLKDLAKDPDRIQHIKDTCIRHHRDSNGSRKGAALLNVFSSEADGQDGCLICHL
jgi:hypothetical protein